MIPNGLCHSFAVLQRKWLTCGLSDLKSLCAAQSESCRLALGAVGEDQNDRATQR